MERDSPSSGRGGSKGAPGGRSLGERTGGGRRSPRPRPFSDVPPPASRFPREPDASGTPRVPLSLPGLPSGTAPQGPLQAFRVPAYDRVRRGPAATQKTRETPERLPGRQRPRSPRNPRRRRGRGCREGRGQGRGRAAPTKGRRGAGRPAR